MEFGFPGAASEWIAADYEPRNIYISEHVLDDYVVYYVAEGSPNLLPISIGEDGKGLNKRQNDLLRCCTR